MITFDSYGAQTNAPIASIKGKSTDMKPLVGDNGIPLTNGSLFIEIDTGKCYFFDEETQAWLEV